MNASGTYVEIPLNKTKIILMLLGSIALIGRDFGLSFLLRQFKILIGADPTRLAIVGYASIILFGFLAVIFIQK